MLVDIFESKFGRSYCKKEAINMKTSQTVTFRLIFSLYLFMCIEKIKFLYKSSFCILMIERTVSVRMFCPKLGIWKLLKSWSIPSDSLGVRELCLRRLTDNIYDFVVRWIRGLIVNRSMWISYLFSLIILRFYSIIS